MSDDSHEHEAYRFGLLVEHYEDLTDEQKGSDEIMALGVKYGLAVNDALFQIIYIEIKALSEYMEDVERLRALKGEMTERGAASIMMCRVICCHTWQVTTSAEKRE